MEIRIEFRACPEMRNDNGRRLGGLVVGELDASGSSIDESVLLEFSVKCNSIEGNLDPSQVVAVVVADVGRLALVTNKRVDA